MESARRSPRKEERRLGDDRLAMGGVRKQRESCFWRAGAAVRASGLCSCVWFGVGRWAPAVSRAGLPASRSRALFSPA